MATGRVPTTANSPLTAKGDLFTYSTAPARLAVGSNGDTIVADSSTSTGLRYTAGTVQSNPVLNSAFQVWQRGTANVTTAIAYTADRWQKGGATHFGVSRQVTGDTTNLPNIQYCARVQRTAASATTSNMDINQSFETINSIPFVGKTVTFSFYARAGANYSATSNLLNGTIYTGTGTDQNLISSYTGAATPISVNATLTTTWQRFTGSGTISSSATEMAVYIQGTPTGTAGANDYYEVTGVQIDIGSVALPFRTYAGTIQGELAACQRYYYRIRGDEGSSGTTNSLGLGTFYNSTVFRSPIRYPVKMRRIPDFTSANTAAYFLIAANGSVPTYSSVTLDNSSVDAALLNVAVTGATGGQSGWLQTNNALSFVDFSAEL